MRDPEKPKENWNEVTHNRGDRTWDDKEAIYRWYLTNSSEVRKNNGIGRDANGKWVVEDLEKIKKFDDWTKAVLREFLKGS